ncbi:MAG: hypothetical protein EBZ74_01350 [Planctomycetia bacterium]|nr:hypothetical protein [Planctomycetia bacterium]
MIILRRPAATSVLRALFCALASAARAADTGLPRSLDAFARDCSPLVAARLDATPRHYRQIEPSLYHLAEAHAGQIATLSRDEQADVLVKLARFIDERRDAAGDVAVIAPDRPLIGLLDPDRGLDPKEITALASAYGTTATVFKKDGPDETVPSVAADFLSAVKEAAATDAPSTIVVLGHGLPTEIQSYSIPSERLAESLLDGAARRAAANPTGIDLGHLVLVFDDCYSADFSLNLANALERGCRDRGLALASLPYLIAGTNRNCVGHADVSEKFVPHFWRDVIELFYVRRPRPGRITLRDFFDKVDNMMYGYGRAAQVGRDGIVTYRLVDPEQCQDPVVFVPLDEAAITKLRTILGLPADARLPRILDIG